MTGNKVTDAPLLAPIEAANYLGGFSVKTLANWRAAGTGPSYIEIRGDGQRRPSIRYRRSDLDAWIASFERHGTDKGEAE